MPVGDDCEEKNTLSRITTKNTSKRLDCKKIKVYICKYPTQPAIKKNTTLISWLISNYKKPRCTMKYLLSLLLLLSASVFVSCEKDEDKTLARPRARKKNCWKSIAHAIRNWIFRPKPTNAYKLFWDQRDDSQKQKCTKHSTALRGCFMLNEKLKQMALWSPIWAGSAIYMVV